MSESDPPRTIGPSVSARILALLDLPGDASEDDALGAILKLQTELEALRPRLATELPARLRYWRRRAGIMSKELARKLGLSPSAVSTWESGRSLPDIATLERACFLCAIDLPTFWAPLPEDNGGETSSSPPAKQAASG